MSRLRGPLAFKSQSPLLLSLFGSLHSILKPTHPPTAGSGWLPEANNSRLPRLDWRPVKERGLGHSCLGTQTWAVGAGSPWLGSSLCVCV